jgi:hypothetical protein
VLRRDLKHLSSGTMAVVERTKYNPAAWILSGCGQRDRMVVESLSAPARLSLPIVRCFFRIRKRVGCDLDRGNGKQSTRLIAPKRLQRLCFRMFWSSDTASSELESDLPRRSW